MITIKPVKAFRDNLIWIIKDKCSNKSIVVDPGEAKPVLQFIEKNSINLVGIFITHHHFDHTGGINQLTSRFSVPVYGPASANIPGITEPLIHGRYVNIESLKLKVRVIASPGHTSDHLIYYIDDEEKKYLFTGDTLFTAGCGRIFEGTAEDMYRSLMNIKNFPGDTYIFPAHEYVSENLRFAAAVEPDNMEIKRRIEEVNLNENTGKLAIPTTLTFELKTNPFLRCGFDAVHKRAEQHSGEILENEVDVFRVLRLWKNNF